MLSKSLKKEIIALVLLTVICIILGICLYENIEVIDKIVLNFIRDNLINDVLKNIMYSITMILSPIPMLIIGIITILICNNKVTPVFTIANISFAGITTIILKNIFRRERPLEFMLIEETGYSFPSGHSIMAVAFFGALIYCINKYSKSKIVKIICNILFGILAILIPITRIYLGVHNLSDIIIGVIIGYIILKINICFLDKIKLKTEKLKLEEKK